MNLSNAITGYRRPRRRSILTAPFRRAWGVLGKATAVNWGDATLDVAAVLVTGAVCGATAWALGELVWRLMQTFGGG